jgi:hypothetical protein
MQNQVPLWVTLALALVAIAGPIGGAWIGGTVTAKRDDRRWHAEAEREERRRRHEDERADEVYWRNARATAYAAVAVSLSEYLVKASNAISWLKARKPRDKELVSGESLVLLEESANKNIDTLVHAALCSQIPMAVLCTRLERYVYSILTYATECYEGLCSGQELDAAKIKHLEMDFDMLSDVHDGFQDAARSELGIPGYPSSNAVAQRIRVKDQRTYSAD